MNLIDQLKEGNKKVAIIGLGYLGYSNLIQLLRYGINCTVTDLDEKVLKDFKIGMYPPKDRFLFWNTKSVLKNDWDKLCNIVEPEDIIHENNAVYLICVPFEYTIRSSLEKLIKTLHLFKNIRKIHLDFQPLVFFEGILKPGTMKQTIIPEFESLGIHVDKDLVVIYAPRRDWYLHELIHGTEMRYAATEEPEHELLIHSYFELIQKKTTFTKDVTCLEIAACLRNALSHVGQALINQLVLAYPNQNIMEASKLANLGLEPSIVSASRIPLSSQFLIDSARHSSYLSLLEDAISADFSLQQSIVELLKRKEIKKVAILGLLSHENTAEDRMNPTLMLPKLMLKEGMDIKINDPFIDKEEIYKLTSCDYLNFPHGLEDREAIIILTAHDHYRSQNKRDLQAKLKLCKIILDNTGIWSGMTFTNKKITYKIIGELDCLSF